MRVQAPRYASGSIPPDAADSSGNYHSAADADGAATLEEVRRQRERFFEQQVSCAPPTMWPA